MAQPMKSSICKLVCAAITLAGPLAHAAPFTLWNNGGPSISTPGGSEMSSYLQAANFTTSFATNLSSASFWSLEAGSSYDGSITYSILGNAIGSLGESPDENLVFASGSVAPTRTDTLTTALGLNVFQYDFALAVTNLAAGTYWLALHNGALSAGANVPDFYWAWSDANATTGGAIFDQERSLFPPDPTWGTNQAEHAFLIAGERFVEQQISEPGTPLLVTLAAGLGLILSRRRTTA